MSPRSIIAFLGASSLLAITTTACSSAPHEDAETSEHANTADAVSMIACPANDADPSCPTGRFAVTCKDGSREVATVAQIQQDRVCNVAKPAAGPFDPESCTGAAMTKEEAVTLFAPGTADAVIGEYVIQMRSRPCNSVTGCGAWGETTTRLGSSIGSLSRNLEMKGEIHLKVEGQNVVLELGNGGAGSRDGSRCSHVGGAQTCSAYHYVAGHQWGGSGGYFPTQSAVIKTDGNRLTLKGLLTKSCLRLTDTARSSSAEEEYVLYAKLTAAKTPPKSECAADHTPMKCGSKAPSMTTCCRAGLRTCPQSGCDCWAACN